MSLAFSVTDTLTPAMQKIAEQFPEAATQAIGVAGLAVIEDAGSGRPRKPPIEYGNLRASWFVYAGIDGALRLIAKDKAAVPGSIPGIAGAVQATIGYNAPYALVQHENLRPAGGWYPRGPGAEDPTVGGHWLLEALSRNRARYVEAFANVFTKFLKRFDKQ